MPMALCSWFFRCPFPSHTRGKMRVTHEATICGCCFGRFPRVWGKYGGSFRKAEHHVGVVGLPWEAEVGSLATGSDIYSLLKARAGDVLC